MSKRTLIKLAAISLSILVIATQIFGLPPVSKSSAAQNDYYSPFDTAYSPDGTMIAVTDLTKARLNIINASTGSVQRTVQLNGQPKSVVWNGNTRVYAAEYGAGTIAEIDTANGNILRRLSAGRNPVGIAMSSGKLIVTDFGMKSVKILDLNTGNVLADTAVKEYPYFLDVTTSGNYAVVGHATPVGNAMSAGYSASVSFIDIAAGTVASNIALPTGSTNVRDIKCSPDGKWAYILHTLGRISLPTTQITKGWVNTNALSIIDIASKSLYTTVLLDTLYEGAADPWGLAISSDSNTLWVSISGNHQVYKVDLYNLHQLLLGNIEGAGSGIASVNKLEYLPRQDGNSNGNITSYKVYTSTDGTNFTQAASGSWANNATLKTATFTARNASYVKLEAVSGYGGYASAAEVKVYKSDGTQVKAWSVTATSEQASAGNTASCAIDGNNSTIWHAQWSPTVAPLPQSVTLDFNFRSPDLRFRSKAAYSKPYSDIWFFIKADPSKRALLKNDLGALWSAGLLTKIKLPGQGPRGISLSPNGSTLAVGAYFAGQIYTLNTSTNQIVQTIPLGTQPAEDQVRRGERTFFDASTTTQKWLSCATCHPEGRTDGLNWDMPNDGVGNTKNTKSMYKVFETPPAMWRGIREDAATGVRAAFRFIKFKEPTQQELDDVGAYIRSFTEETSPYRNTNGSMTADALAGKAIFESAEAQCATCHSGTNLTDLTIHDVGTKDPYDIDGNYVTPPLVELWRTAPYLHDGSAATMRDVLTTRNAGDRHGKTSHLTSAQIDQLAAYMLQVSASQDTQPPTVPGNLTSTGKTDKTVSLSWAASTDNTAVAGYDVYNGSSLAGSTTGTSYTVTGLTANTAYTFTVKARDGAGNVSEASNAVSVTTNPTPPAPTNVAVNKTASADSQETGNPVQNGNDGNTSTRWCAADGGLNHWWKVDLGADYNLTGSEVMWEKNGKVYKYKIEVSSDNTNWSVALDKTNNTSVAQTQSEAFTASARYVRITVTGLESGCWASFFELKVLGTAV